MAASDNPPRNQVRVAGTLLMTFAVVFPQRHAFAEDAPDFAVIQEKWNATVEEIQKLQQEFAKATPERRQEIREQFVEGLGRLEEMAPSYEAAAHQAYLSGDETTRKDALDVLALMLSARLQKDEYEPLYERGQQLAEAGVSDPRILDPAGIAAFVVNDYASARKWLEAAKAANQISSEGRMYLGLIDDYAGYWEKEKAIRAKEATDDLPRVKLETTAGDIVIELLENEAPQTVGNFVSLVEKGFYDGLAFHRVLPNFMAQGGCPDGTGGGGPGYEIHCECYKKGYRRHFRGSLSMAHAGRDTGGSQFFLTFVPTDHLNGKHTVFGRVIEGMENLAKIKRIEPGQPGQDSPTKIVKATVLRKRDHEYEPTKVE